MNANFDGATRNRQINSKQNQATQMVSITKNVQNTFVSPPAWISLVAVPLFVKIGGGTIISLRMLGSVSMMNEAMETVIITIDTMATIRAKLDDSGHSKTSQTARWKLC